MKINEVAKLTGLTVRTLHYYDEIGLLAPGEVTEAGYRLYGDRELEALQQILFFRELEFSLSDIREIMKNPHYNRVQTLSGQRELLMQKRQRLDRLIALVDKTIKGEENMSFKEFSMAEIEENKKKYSAEVKERWGGTAAYDQSEKRTGEYDSSRWEALSTEGDAILREFGENRHIAPESETAQALVRKWQKHISVNFYECTDEILSGLGQMYTADERFTQNLDRNGEGTADFMAAAIEIYCGK